jgi:hypothetical protein
MRQLQALHPFDWHDKVIKRGDIIDVDGPEDEARAELLLQRGAAAGYSPQSTITPRTQAASHDDAAASHATEPMSTRNAPPLANVGRRTRTR